MARETGVVKCSATCPNKYGRDFQCERPKGHKGKHRDGASMWTDDGAERLREERRKAIEAEPF